MAGLNGSVSWQIQPLWWSSSNLAGTFWDGRNNYLKSANDQLRYQVIWTNGTQVNEALEPSAANFSGLPGSATVGNGDLIAVVFKIEATIGDGYWEELGRVKKTRDIANKKYDDGTVPVGHRFTIDISQLVSNELSYSLCPINKGTWQSNWYGGMNGGLTMQDNVLSGAGAMGVPINNYNVSRNGTFRKVRVKLELEIINGEGNIVNVGAGGQSTNVVYINSVNQFEKDSLYYYSSYSIDLNTGYEFLTRCPNFSFGSITEDFKKPVRIDEQAEWLQFFINKNYSNNINPSNTSTDAVGANAIKISTYTSSGIENTFYLRDFESNLLTQNSNGYILPENTQTQMCIQNISPSYIINSGKVFSPDSTRVNTPSSNYPYWDFYTSNTITSNTIYYTAELVKVGMWSPFTVRAVTKKYKYTIDREDEKNAYGFVRFHWLNSMGGIDSYTAKKDVVEGLTISRDVIERKSGDRTWYQDDQNQGTPLGPSVYISDTMRGGDIYKGGREVSNVNAERVQSVYTEPLNKSVAKWLEEMMLSPNVWIEMDTEATEMGNARNPYLRPSDKEYIPVIITNSDVETVNQENGLVKFNIEYTLAHKVITQRN